MLVICKLFPQQWMAVLADDEACSSTVGTPRELEFALQAWMSPLPPPEPERLSDLG